MSDASAHPSATIRGGLSVRSAFPAPPCGFTDERMEKELIPLVKKAAEEISTKLGYQ